MLAFARNQLTSVVIPNSVTQIGYSTAGDSVYIVANYATYGPLGDLDIRYYNAAQTFRVVFRKPLATFFSTTADDAFVYSAVPVDPAPVSYSSVTDATGPAVNDVGTALLTVNQFRMMRFTLLGPATAELLRLNFYAITGTPASYSCGPETAISTVPLSRAYVTLTDSTGAELRMNSYTPATGQACATEYDQSLNTVTQLSTCTLNLSKVAAADRTLYSYNPPTATKPCQIGYSQRQGATPRTCDLNYNFNDLLSRYCDAPLSTATPRLELKSNRSVILYLNDTFTINGYSLTAGHPSKLPVSWKVEGSFNGVTWAQIHSQTNFAGFDTSAPFATSPIFRWNNTTITTQQIPTRTGLQIEAFQNPVVSRALVKKPAPPWLRIQVLETHVASPFVHIGAPLLFLTDSGAIDPKTIQVSNFGGSRRSPQEGAAALLGTTGKWVDYNKAPLLFRFPAERESIRGFRFTVPGGTEVGAIPKTWRIEGSWDTRTWTPIPLVSRLPDGYNDAANTVVRFQQPF